MVSIIIPSRNEKFLFQTTQDVLNKSTGEVEVIVILDGYWPPDNEIIGDKRVIYLHKGKPEGMRRGINDAVNIARGKYIMKIDGHCMFDEGFDEKLAADCEENWLVVPRRYRLDAENWRISKDRTSWFDHLYICYPDDPNDFGGPTLTGREWRDRLNETKDVMIDDLMTFQGSCYFMHRDYFLELGGLDEEMYGTFGKEPQEIGLKVWLGRGRCVRNKNTWYAHLHKGRKYGRGYSLGKGMLDKGGKAINKWLLFGEAWKGQERDFKWLIDRFAPVPGWDKCDWDDMEWKRRLSGLTPKSGIAFHGKSGGSFEIRGKQVAEAINGKINEVSDVNIYVKSEPNEYPKGSYFDPMDAPERVGWLKNNDMGVIASSKVQQEFLAKELDREVILIPQHHCNYNNIKRTGKITTVGVVGGKGALDFSEEELTERFRKIGMEFKWVTDYKTREDVVSAYSDIDIQIVYRLRYLPNKKYYTMGHMKNPLKLVNAMSFGIPTVAYPEIAFVTELDGYFLPAESLDDMVSMVRSLKGSRSLYRYFSHRGIVKAKEYHIDTVSKLYSELGGGVDG